MDPVTPPTHLPTRPPWTVRVAAWSARHRWPVAALWFVATIGLFAGSLLAGGTRSSEAVSNDERSKYEAGEAYVVWGEANANAGEQAPASQQFLLLLSSPDRTLDDSAFQAAIGDVATRISALQAKVGGTTGPVFEELLDPRTAPPEAGLVSADRSTVRIVARVPGDGPVSRSAWRPFRRWCPRSSRPIPTSGSTS